MVCVSRLDVLRGLVCGEDGLLAGENRGQRAVDPSISLLAAHIFSIAS